MRCWWRCCAATSPKREAFAADVLILDSCSVRAKRGGDLAGPNPIDRGKNGTKYHVALNRDGVPVACTAQPRT